MKINNRKPTSILTGKRNICELIWALQLLLSSKYTYIGFTYKFDRSHLMSDKYYFENLFLLKMIALLFYCTVGLACMCAAALVHFCIDHAW